MNLISKYVHLLRVCLWFAVIFFPWTLVTSLHQYDLVFHPFDLTQLAGREVMPFEHRSLRQRYAVKLNSLARRPRPDILITGNHAMRNFQGTGNSENLDFYNFVIGDPTIFDELDLLKALKKIDRLPKKLMIYTIEAHGGERRLKNRNDQIFSTGEAVPPFNMNLGYVGSEISWFFRLETYLDSLFTVFGSDNVIDYAMCEQAYAMAKTNKPGFSLVIRLKISDYFSDTISLNSGLLSKNEYCQNDRNFNALSTTALARNGGHLATRNSELTYDPGEDHPALTSFEANVAAQEVASGMRQLEEFSRENGFRMVYLIPPRYMVPLNDPKDEVSNLVFENNPGFPVIDFRRFSLEKKYYLDHLHLSEQLGEILIPCLKRILESKTALQSSPAVDERGRTMC